MWRELLVVVLKKKGTDEVVMVCGNFSRDEKGSLKEAGMTEENEEILRRVAGPLALDGKMPDDLSGYSLKVLSLGEFYARVGM